jgi:hypothetical protein
MISNAGSRRRLPPVAAGFALVFGLAVASQPALAGVNEDNAGRFLPGAEAGLIPQIGDDGSRPGSATDAPIVVAEKKNKNKNKNWNKHHSNKYNYGPKKKIYVRTWKPKPYYGQFFGGIVLGSILTAGAVGVAPPPPRPGLCWYWSDPYGYRGYWDYCGAPYY